jgi:type II secretory pathway component PulJ
MKTFNAKSILLSRRGLSLVEIMIALTMTLIILGAMMSAFQYGSAEMQKGRAMIELNNKLINVEQLLRSDLSQVTVSVKPHHDLPALPKGYFEYIDGVEADYTPANDAQNLVFGDTDDFLAMTIRSDSIPLRGSNGGQIFESSLAEVVWYSVDGALYRRQLLILPALGTVGAAADIDAYRSNNDISVRVEGGLIVANSLSDLAIRGNRFCHRNPNNFPPEIPTPQLSILETARVIGSSVGVSPMATNVTAFDVQAFAPDAVLTVRRTGTPAQIVDIAEPSDIVSQRDDDPVNPPFFPSTEWTANPATDSLMGAYVDLAKGTGTLGSLPRTIMTPLYTEAVYDTGTSQYNRDDNNDFGSNGVDDNGNGEIDDVGEKTAVAPYNVPLRGLRVRIRAQEPVTKQVSQLTVEQSFMQQ